VLAAAGRGDVRVVTALPPPAGPARLDEHLIRVLSSTEMLITLGGVTDGTPRSATERIRRCDRVNASGDDVKNALTAAGILGDGHAGRPGHLDFTARRTRTPTPLPTLSHRFVGGTGASRRRRSAAYRSPAASTCSTGLRAAIRWTHRTGGTAFYQSQTVKFAVDDNFRTFRPRATSSTASPLARLAAEPDDDRRHRRHERRLRHDAGAAEPDG
jgi:hypothetical protein